MADRKFYIKKNRDDAIRVLKIVIDTLDKYDIKYYLDFGTLIGAVREKGLIPWDDDIDISLVNEGDYKKIPKVLEEIQRKSTLRTYLFTFRPVDTRKRKKRRKEMIKKGKSVYKGYVTFTDIDNIRIAKIRTNKFWIFGRGNTCIDIFCKYKFNNKIYWLADGIENNVPLEYMSKELTTIDFCGLKCSIPKDYDKYLTYIYGDWKTPNESWVEEDSNTNNV